MEEGGWLPLFERPDWVLRTLTRRRIEYRRVTRRIVVGRWHSDRVVFLTSKSRTTWTGRECQEGLDLDERVTRSPSPRD